MVFKKRKKSKLLDIGKSMPTLYHTLPNEEFDYDKSQVLKWIASQPELLKYMHNKLSNIGYIEYDKTTGTWKGIDVHD
jgi:hypothetical protein|nr:MAG TPA: hypothetical protein [Caudoviricetes sp.]DAS69355.1 MAG TPA: hypothetical protein [Caudoviricetes sp.]